MTIRELFGDDEEDDEEELIPADPEPRSSGRADTHAW